MNNDTNNRSWEMFRAYNNGDFTTSFKIAREIFLDSRDVDYLTFCFHLKLLGVENVEMPILIDSCLDEKVRGYYEGILLAYFGELENAEKIFLKIRKKNYNDIEYSLYAIYKAQSGLYLVAQRASTQSAAIESHYSLTNRDKYNFLMGKPSSVSYHPNLHTPRVIYGIISSNEEEQYKRQDIKEIYPAYADRMNPGFIIPVDLSQDISKQEEYPGTSWHDVTLTIDYYNGNIKISVTGYRSKIVHHCAMGFPKDYPDKPSVLWKLFLDLVKIRNDQKIQETIANKQDSATKTYKSNISRIRTIFRGFFGTEVDPFYPYHDKKCYLLIFQVKLGDVDYK